MLAPKKPFFIPIATLRNKRVLAEIVSGTTVLIDVMNSEYPYNRTVTRCWLDAHEDATKKDIIWFENGPAGERVKYGDVDDVQSLMKKSETVL